jgi:hypothetical protein
MSRARLSRAVDLLVLVLSLGFGLRFVLAPLPSPPSGERVG